jgi:hypothetical protein
LPAIPEENIDLIFMAAPIETAANKAIAVQFHQLVKKQQDGSLKNSMPVKKA